MQLAYEPRFSIPINGVEYTVGIATDEAMNGLRHEPSDAGNEGVTDTHLALILIAESVPEHRRPTVFWHEFVHAAFGESGDELYSAVVICAREMANDSQEQLCRFLGPIISATLAGPDAIFDLLKGPVGSPTKGRSGTKNPAKKRKAGSK